MVDRVEGLTGTLPRDGLSDLFELSSVNLGSSDFLSGTLPASVGLLTKLNTLRFDRSLISGTIPEELCSPQHTQLNRISLGRSALSGTIPANCMNLASLNTLYLKRTRISGTIPPIHAGSLVSLDLADMKRLSGSLPPQLGTLHSLHTLNVDRTLLSGSIPSSLALLSKLTDCNLRVSSRSFRCPYPENVTKQCQTSTCLKPKLTASSSLPQAPPHSLPPSFQQSLPPSLPPSFQQSLPPPSLSPCLQLRLPPSLNPSFQPSLPPQFLSPSLQPRLPPPLPQHTPPPDQEFHPIMTKSFVVLVVTSLALVTCRYSLRCPRNPHPWQHKNGLCSHTNGQRAVEMGSHIMYMSETERVTSCSDLLGFAAGRDSERSS